MSWQLQQLLHPLLFLEVQAGHRTGFGCPVPQPFLVMEFSLKDGSVTCEAAPGPQQFINLRRKVTQGQGQCPFTDPEAGQQLLFSSRELLTAARPSSLTIRRIFNRNSSQQEKSWLLELFHISVCKATTREQKHLKGKESSTQHGDSVPRKLLSTSQDQQQQLEI